jgi:hypothetical protein
MDNTDCMRNGLVRRDISMYAASWAYSVLRTGKCPFQHRTYTYSTIDDGSLLRYDLFVGFDAINASLDALPVRKKNIYASDWFSKWKIAC